MYNVKDKLRDLYSSEIVWISAVSATLSRGYIYFNGGVLRKPGGDKNYIRIFINVLVCSFLSTCIQACALTDIKTT